jgi:outer membrane lipoprotein SlyB
MSVLPASVPSGTAAATRMLARFRDVCIDANDPQLVGAFWGAVLGRDPEDAGQGDGSTPDVFLAPGADGGPGIFVNGVPEPKAGKVRLHLDVTLEPGQEITDLLRLGATVVSEPSEVRWWVLADPEGHEFCAFAPESDATNDADAEVATDAPA